MKIILLTLRSKLRGKSQEGI